LLISEQAKESLEKMKAPLEELNAPLEKLRIPKYISEGLAWLEKQLSGKQVESRESVACPESSGVK